MDPIKRFTCRGVERTQATLNGQHLAVDCTEVSDGYHTFDELYDHRRALNAALFQLIAITTTYEVVKAKFHHDGTMFAGGYFVVIAYLPQGQVSYHYTLDHWDEFQIPAVERPTIPWDGHQAGDTITRLQEFVRSLPPVGSTLTQAKQ